MSEYRDDIVVRVESMLSQMSSKASYNPNIYKVDKSLRQVNERAYDPELVAIGPIHHNKDHLKDMKQLKVSYLYEFLQRENQTVETYVVKLRELEGRARNCYSDFIQLPDTDKFVEMLLLDVFFVIVLLRKLHFPNWRVKNEYIFQSSQARKRVILDLLLVENQLPFFILSQLFDMTKSSHPDDNLGTLVPRQLCWVLPWEDQYIDRQMDVQYVHDHLLGMVYGAYFKTMWIRCSGRSDKRSNSQNLRNYEAINTALELEETGIQFKTATRVNFVNVSFTSDGVLQLPHLSVDDDTETILRNFIAYEQMQPYNHEQLRYVSDYSELMTNLVNSSKDVEILRRAGVFRNVLGDDETVHLMFNKLGKHVLIDYDDFCHSEVFHSVNRYYSRRRNKWMAVLRRKYFHNPWTILSVIAAIILLFLAAIQTLFSILSYKK